jgi:hypothetical protein
MVLIALLALSCTNARGQAAYSCVLLNYLIALGGMYRLFCFHLATI